MENKQQSVSQVLDSQRWFTPGYPFRERWPIMRTWQRVVLVITAIFILLSLALTVWGFSTIFNTSGVLHLQTVLVVIEVPIMAVLAVICAFISRDTAAVLRAMKAAESTDD
jgi:sterol desaturase/sphingolipid hydroxylase (fatty acid hydroxylase superfamily)